jgi:hypothetical protein
MNNEMKNITRNITNIIINNVDNDSDDIKLLSFNIVKRYNDYKEFCIRRTRLILFENMDSDIVSKYERFINSTLFVNDNHVYIDLLYCFTIIFIKRITRPIDKRSIIKSLTNTVYIIIEKYGGWDKYFKYLKMKHYRIHIIKLRTLTFIFIVFFSLFIISLKYMLIHSFF